MGKSFIITVIALLTLSIFADIYKICNSVFSKKYIENKIALFFQILLWSWGICVLFF